MKGLPLLEEKKISEKKQFEEETRIHFENYWSFEPAYKKDPLETALGQKRIQRTLSVIKEPVTTQKIIDIGCGTGWLSEEISKKGAEVSAVDVAINAIKKMSSPISFSAGCFPFLKFPDGSFNGAILADVIAELQEPLYRLALSELARLINKDGWIVISTPIDLYSSDALAKFYALVNTEFIIEEKVLSYHRLHFYLERLLKAPACFVQSKEPKFRLRQLEKRSGLFRLWFYFNSSSWMRPFWRLFDKPLQPVKKKFLKSQRLLNLCERLTKALWHQRGITHVIVRARKKRLF